jgi:hypothetical protein
MAARGEFRLVIPRAAILFAAMVAPGSTSAAEETTLVRQSPFGSVVAPGDYPKSSSPELELRGIMSTSEGIQYCIYDPGRKSGIWASVGEIQDSFVVKGGDPAMDEVRVEMAGRLVMLRMRDSKVIPAMAEEPAPPQAATPHISGRRRPGDPRAPHLESGE